MFDPLSLIYSAPWRLFEVWHKDPCLHGNDDSCARPPLDEAQVTKVCRWLESDWAGTWTMAKEDWDEEDGPYKPRTRNTGLFYPNGQPRMSVHAIALNIYLTAAHEMLGRRKANKFMREHLVDILIFAENPVDSMYNEITSEFKDKPNPDRERLVRMAMRDIQQKTKSRCWRHLRFSFPILHQIKRFLVDRCARCHKSLGFNKSVVQQGDGSLTCERCNTIKPR